MKRPRWKVIISAGLVAALTPIAAWAGWRVATWSVALATEPVALTVDKPALAGRRAVPVTTGLPLAKGVLKSA